MIESFGEKISKYLIHIIFIVVSLCCVVPFLYVVSASLTSPEGFAMNGYTLIPSDFSLEAYEYCFKSVKSLLDSYWVTIKITVIGTVLSLIITSMMGYVISRRSFAWHRGLSFMVFFTMLFSGGLVAQYLLVTKYYGLRDNIWALILPCFSAWNCMLFKGFFSNIPDSLVEASKLDGCTEYGTFFRIVVPISKPAFATVGLYFAFGYWSSWYNCMLYTTKSELVTLQYYLQRIMQNIELLEEALRMGAGVSIDITNVPKAATRMALCVLAAGPMLLIFPFFQKYFTKGLTVGSVKE